jgi:hypothetical protein
MLQLIGLIAALIANLLFAPLPLHSGDPVGISGGGPVGRPHPRPTPTAPPRMPIAPH